MRLWGQAAEGFGFIVMSGRQADRYGFVIANLDHQPDGNLNHQGGKNLWA